MSIYQIGQFSENLQNQQCHHLQLTKNTWLITEISLLHRIQNIFSVPEQAMVSHGEEITIKNILKVIQISQKQ